MLQVGSHLMLVALPKASRIAMACAAYSRLVNLWRRVNVRRSANVRVYIAAVSALLMPGCET